MRKLTLTAAASGLALVIAACGEEAAQKEQNEVAANDMNAMMNDPNNPFAHAEMQMNDRMMAAVGITAGDTWVRKMIEHHRGAVEMSRQVLTLSPPANVAEMAQMTIDKQGKEITALEKLVASGAPNPASSELYRTASTNMHDAMMAAKGANVSETYLRKMLEHHKGAVALSDVALANGATGAVRAQVEKTKADQLKEIAHLEAMLRGEAHRTAMASDPKASTTAARPAAPAPAEQTAAKSTPKSTPKAPPAKKTAPPAEPKVDPTCTPEHRAAGHC
jgi:uncharacterized protein (DUF305 family)